MQDIYAVDVEEGDTLVDLDNGYVFEVGEADDMFSMRDGRYSFAMGEGRKAIGFHDAEGNENYLIVWDDHPIRVTR